MSSVACLCMLLPILLLLCCSSAAKPSMPHALLFKVTKDPSTSQYITELNQRTPLVPIKLTFDLSGDTLWVDCNKGYISSTYKPVYCLSPLCKSLHNPLGCSKCYIPPKPGCNNNTCSIFPDNSITKTSAIGELAKDVVSLQSTDGSNPGKVVSYPRFVFTCGVTSLLKGLAKGVKGMAGFSKSAIGIPSQLSHAFRLPRIFAICLSSSTGFAVVGDGPYNVLPGVELSQRLTYTPLINISNHIKGSNFSGNNPANEYYIGVRGIKINSENVRVNTTLLKINKKGHGGTKISTVVPYTVLERSIYNAITEAFVNAISKVPRLKPVPPFKVCYNSSSLGSTLVGPGVPPIELVLHQKNVTWIILGVNSMVLVKSDVYCLGFVDGGVDPQTSIVIGGHQLQDAFLKFDLDRSRLGFISTIIGRRTGCANFNFTSNA